MSRQPPAGDACRPGDLPISLLEDGLAGVAEARLLAAQAVGDGPDVGDFAGAETIDVRGAGPTLLRRRQRLVTADRTP